MKDKAFSTFLDQNPPFELRRKLPFRFQSFHEIQDRNTAPPVRRENIDS
jgi:hypothetical protein